MQRLLENQLNLRSISSRSPWYACTIRLGASNSLREAPRKGQRAGSPQGRPHKQRQAMIFPRKTANKRPYVTSEHNRRGFGDRRILVKCPKSIFSARISMCDILQKKKFLLFHDECHWAKSQNIAKDQSNKYRWFSRAKILDYY